MPSRAEEPAQGLRERKKAKTRAAIQRHALRLFREQGYEETTVSQIAEVAEVSESTFFRYFPSKEDVVLQDDYDEGIIMAFMAQPAELSPIQAMRAALRAVFLELDAEDMAELRERTVLILSVPELREAVAGQLVQSLRETAGLLAQRSGRRDDDVAVLTVAGAVIGAMMAVTLVAVEDPSVDLVRVIDEALGHLESGLRL